MRLLRSRPARISVIVPAYNVETYLADCLDSILASTHRELDVVVVDDGSTDATGTVADAGAARDPRVRVVHTANQGLGAARNEGMRAADGDLVTFVDSDDVIPPDALATMARHQARSSSDFVVGSIAWWEGDQLAPLPWMRRLHAKRRVITIDDLPEMLGDVFACNKLFRRDFWDAVGLTWPQGTRYEDQPTTTRAYLEARRFTVIPDVVYHWRMRDDGSSITQQRATVEDLRDRWNTKRTSRQRVHDYGSPKVTKVFTERVLPGDLPRYFVHIPDADDAWYALLESGVREFFGTRSLVHSILPPVHRLTGWLVEQGRRDDAALVMRTVAQLPPGERVARVDDGTGRRLDVPGLNWASVDRAALAVRSNEG